MVNASVEIESPGDVEMTVTITATLDAWEKVLADLDTTEQKRTPTWIKDVLQRSIRRMKRQFTVDLTDKVVE